MKLAIIRQRYTPYGGAEQFVARAMGTLRAQGVKLTLVTRKWQATDSYEVISCNPFYIGRLWRDWGFARQACKAVKQTNAELVQSHERIACCDIFRAGDGVHREWLKQRRRVMGPLQKLALKLNPYHRYVMAAEQGLFQSPRLKAVICVSEMVRREIQSYFTVPEHKLHVIHSGVDTAAFQPGLKGEYRSRVREQYGISEHARVFLFVGSGFLRKGLGAALQALAALPEDAHLIVVGGDRRAASYKRQALQLGLAGQVHFAGSRKDVKPFYGAADALVLPTLYDPFPNVAMEAFACGLPVITSHKCGASELIVDGENGFVCDALDIAELRRSMEAVLPLEVAAKMGVSARKTAEAYPLERMGSQLIDLYEQLRSLPPKHRQITGKEAHENTPAVLGPALGPHDLGQKQDLAQAVAKGGPPKRIALALMRYNPHGGYERQAKLLAEFLTARGYSVTVVSGEPVPAFGSNIAFRKIPVLKGASWLRVWSFALFSKKYFSDMRRDYDMVIAFDRSLGMDIYRAGNACHREWIRVRKQLGGLRDRISIALNPLHPVVNQLEKRLFSQIEHAAGRVVVLSEQGAEQIRRYYPVAAERFAVIPPAVDFERFREQYAPAFRQQQRQRLGIDNDSWVLLHVGSGFRIKGLERTIRAMAQLKAGRRKVRLIVVGNDQKGTIRHAQLAERLGMKNDVEFVGGVQNVGQYYAAADIFVLPSLLDTFGVTVVEALSFGLPVVVSKGAGASTLIRDETLGRVVEVQPEPQDLADAITQCILSDRDIAHSGALERRMEHRREAARQCEMEQIMGRYLNLIEDSYARRHACH